MQDTRFKNNQLIPLGSGGPHVPSVQVSLRLVFTLIVACAIGLGCGSDDSDSTDSQPARSQSSVSDSSGSTSSGPPETAVSVPDSPNGQDRDFKPEQASSSADVREKPPVVYRPSWPRREINDERLRVAGLVRHVTPGFDLITDIGPEKSQPLLGLIEPLSRYHESYFGELPPAQDSSEYRVSGYVMRDQELFSAARLLPDGGLLAFHGRQIGPEFWMNDQPWDYYRRHLLLHEATHAFMKHIPGYAEELPLWYLEGMAEMMATHSIDDQGNATFNVMPPEPGLFIGHERIAIVRRDAQENGIRSIEQITSFESEDFHKVEAYAWSWALCRFLDSHPRYQERFRKIARQLITHPFTTNLAEQFRVDNDRLRVDWTVFAAGIEYGYDFQLAQLDFPDASPAQRPVTIEISSGRGWQSSGVTVAKDQRIDVSAAGRFTLADAPKPWVSEANGISFRYYAGQPLGRLLGTVIAIEDGRVSMTPPIPLGQRGELIAPISGTLFLRLNDHWGELSDNRGSVNVMVQP